MELNSQVIDQQVLAPPKGLVATTTTSTKKGLLGITSKYEFYGFATEEFRINSLRTAGQFPLSMGDLSFNGDQYLEYFNCYVKPALSSGGGPSIFDFMLPSRLLFLFRVMGSGASTLTMRFCKAEKINMIRVPGAVSVDDIKDIYALAAARSPCFVYFESPWPSFNRSMAAEPAVLVEHLKAVESVATYNKIWTIFSTDFPIGEFSPLIAERLARGNGAGVYIGPDIANMENLKNFITKKMDEYTGSVENISLEVISEIAVLCRYCTPREICTFIKTLVDLVIRENVSKFADNPEISANKVITSYSLLMAINSCPKYANAANEATVSPIGNPMDRKSNFGGAFMQMVESKCFQINFCSKKPVSSVQIYGRGTTTPNANPTTLTQLQRIQQSQQGLRSSADSPSRTPPARTSIVLSCPSALISPGVSSPKETPTADTQETPKATLPTVAAPETANEASQETALPTVASQETLKAVLPLVGSPKVTSQEPPTPPIALNNTMEIQESRKRQQELERAKQAFAKAKATAEDRKRLEEEEKAAKEKKRFEREKEQAEIARKRREAVQAADARLQVEATKRLEKKKEIAAQRDRERQQRAVAKPIVHTLLENMEIGGISARRTEGGVVYDRLAASTDYSDLGTEELNTHQVSLKISEVRDEYDIGGGYLFDSDEEGAGSEEGEVEPDDSELTLSDDPPIRPALLSIIADINNSAPRVEGPSPLKESSSTDAEAPTLADESSSTEMTPLNEEPTPIASINESAPVETPVETPALADESTPVETPALADESTPVEAPAEDRKRSRKRSNSPRSHEPSKRRRGRGLAAELKLLEFENPGPNNFFVDHNPRRRSSASSALYKITGDSLQRAQKKADRFPHNQKLQEEAAEARSKQATKITTTTTTTTVETVSIMMDDDDAAALMDD